MEAAFADTAKRALARQQRLAAADGAQLSASPGVPSAPMGSCGSGPSHACQGTCQCLFMAWCDILERMHVEVQGLHGA